MNEREFKIFGEFIQNTPSKAVMEQVIATINTHLKNPEDKAARLNLLNAAMALSIKSAQLADEPGSHDFIADALLSGRGFELLSKIKDKN